jgi:hypothetical protein
MIEKYITNIDTLKGPSKIIDHEKFNIEKDTYNIYNNNIDEPLHKFWFIIESSKFHNSYYEYNILKFVINDKNNQIKKILDYIKEITETIKEKYIIFLKKNNILYDEINIELPFKQYEDYPCIINFYNKEVSIYNENNGKDEIINLRSGNKYILLFEINYFRITKIDDSKINIKFYFNILKIQNQQLINLDNYSLNKLYYPINNIIPNPPPPPPYQQQQSSIYLLKDKYNETINNKINNKINDKVRIIISDEELLSKKNELKSIKLVKTSELCNKDKIDDNKSYTSVDDFTKDLINQKTLLKEVKKKKLKKSKKKSKIELEKELENN